jgi:hypothetical protein
MMEVSVVREQRKHGLTTIFGTQYRCVKAAYMSRSYVNDISSWTVHFEMIEKEGKECAIFKELHNHR